MTDEEYKRLMNGLVLATRAAKWYNIRFPAQRRR